ncbi:MAG TPA: TolC family protein [Vicinamibacterales bacterium]|nr:TolC family protein [Vicinamibacterales bacterium]
MMQSCISTCLAAVAVAAGLASPALAQTTPRAGEDRIAVRYLDPIAGLSMEQAVALALQREPELLAARTAIAVARGARQQATLRPNPSLSVMRQNQIAGADNVTSAEVEWPLDLFRRGSRVAAADRGIEVAELAVAEQERLLAATIRAAYGELAASARDVAVTDALVTSMRRSYELLRARVEEGAAPPLERNIVEVELHRLESQRLLQAGNAEAALIALKRSLGGGPHAVISVRDTLEALVQADVAAPATIEMPANAPRADIREAEARLRLAEARIDEARNEGRFDINVFGSYMRMNFSFPQMAFGSRGMLEPIQGIFHNLAAGAMVVVPLNNRNQGAVAAAMAERAGAEHLRDARALTAESEVAAAAARDAHARRAVAVYDAGVRTLAQQNLDVVRETYQLGRITLTDVLTEQRRYLEIETGYTAALRAAFEARTALKRALGEVK